MAQSKKKSFQEATVNVFIGMLISLAATYVIFPACGMITTHSQNILSVIGFTVVSFIRQYVIRRWFNKQEVVTSEYEAGDVFSTAGETLFVDKVVGVEKITTYLVSDENGQNQFEIKLKS